MHQRQSNARKTVLRNPQRSTVTMHTAYKSALGDSTHTGVGQLTSLTFFPFNSEINLSNRSSSASMPTAERTFLTSLEVGEAFPPIWRVGRRQYDASVVVDRLEPGGLFSPESLHTLGKFYKRLSKGDSHKSLRRRDINNLGRSAL